MAQDELEIMVKLTGCWTRLADNGRVFLSGSVSDTIELIILPVEHRRSESDPEWEVFLCERPTVTNRIQADTTEPRVTASVGSKGSS